MPIHPVIPMQSTVRSLTFTPVPVPIESTGVFMGRPDAAITVFTGSVVLPITTVSPLAPLGPKPITSTPDGTVQVIEVLIRTLPSKRRPFAAGLVGNGLVVQ